MIGSRTFGRNEAKAAKSSRAARPTLEGLEDRMLLYATEGALWHFPARVTYSFVPDNTSIGGVPSNLFSTLNSYYPTATWEAQIKEAFATWEDETAINLTQVSDNGEAYDTYGDQQDDPNVGDIRISMINMGNNGELAVTSLPPTINGGTNAGDITFNSYYYWGINNGNYDIQTVALHEIGHALGLADTTDTHAVMYPWYEGVNQNPDADDIAGIQSLYGPTGGMTESNRYKSGAKDITWMIQNNQIDSYNLSINGPTDGNWYKVVAPTTTTGTMNVTMQTTNLSSLSPWLQVYNSANQGVLLAQSKLTNQWGATAAVTIYNVTPGQTYYIFTSTATSPGAWGAYALLVNFGNNYQAPQAPPNTVVPWAPDKGGGSSSDAISTHTGLTNAQADSGAAVSSFSSGSGGYAPHLVRLGTIMVYGDAYSRQQPQSPLAIQTRSPELLVPDHPANPSGEQTTPSAQLAGTNRPAKTQGLARLRTPTAQLLPARSPGQAHAYDEALTQWTHESHPRSPGATTVAQANLRHTHRHGH